MSTAINPNTKLVLDDEQSMLQDAAKEYFSQSLNVDAFRGVRDQQGVVRADHEVWRSMVEMGWSSILVPEELGGLDFGVTGMGVLCIEAGKALAASPLQSSAALSIEALLMCQASECRDDLIGQVAAGQTLLVSSIDSALDYVAEGTTADKLLVLTPAGNDPQKIELFDLTNGQTIRSSRRLFDFRDYAQIDLTGVEAEHSFAVEDGVDVAARFNKVGAVLSASELFGITSEVFARTIAYVSERKQFGQEIGSFQAIQHRLAQLYMQIEMFKSVLYDALHAVEARREDQALAVSHAKVMANDVSQAVCTEAIQLHGGMGITDELDIGLFYKRARVLRSVFGGTSMHKAKLAKLSNL